MKVTGLVNPWSSILGPLAILSPTGRFFLFPSFVFVSFDCSICLLSSESFGSPFVIGAHQAYWHNSRVFGCIIKPEIPAHLKFDWGPDNVQSSAMANELIHEAFSGHCLCLPVLRSVGCEKCWPHVSPSSQTQWRMKMARNELQRRKMERSHEEAQDLKEWAKTMSMM